MLRIRSGRPAFRLDRSAVRRAKNACRLPAEPRRAEVRRAASRDRRSNSAAVSTCNPSTVSHSSSKKLGSSRPSALSRCREDSRPPGSGEAGLPRATAREVAELEVDEIGPKVVEVGGRNLDDMDVRREVTSRGMNARSAPIARRRCGCMRPGRPSPAEQPEELPDDEALGEFRELVADEQDAAHVLPPRRWSGGPRRRSEAGLSVGQLPGCAAMTLVLRRARAGDDRHHASASASFQIAPAPFS